MPKITAVIVQARSITEQTLEVPQGCTLGDFLRQLSVAMPARSLASIYGEKRDLTTVLQDQDRVEWCVPILCDPKAKRRQRARIDGDVRVITCGRHGGRHRLQKEASSPRNQD